jgi:hypothetical protein
VSTRGDFKQARNGCGFAVLIWLVVGGILILPFQGHGGFWDGVAVVLFVAWTVLAYKLLSELGSASYYEKQRWQRQEATRLRKKAWKEGPK